MRSPLPDSGNLEAGIVEDQLPSRLSRVHDNVRNLLRRSVLGSTTCSVVSSPAAPSTPSPPHDHILPSPAFAEPTPTSPPRSHARSSPISSTWTISPEDIPGVLFPPWRNQESVDRHEIPETDPRALTTNTRHPDLSSPALSTFIQQKHIERQQKAWKRQHKTPRKQSHRPPQHRPMDNLHHPSLRRARSTGNVPRPSNLPLPIRLANPARPLPVPANESCESNPRLESGGDATTITTITTRSQAPPTTLRTNSPSSQSTDEHFIPPTPIPVHVASDADASAERPRPPPSAPAPAREMAEVLNHCYDDGNKGRKPPPPAYGSTACSVRADPELLHWQAVLAPVVIEGGLPSPGYEEVVREGRDG
ncbi:hypothetical protein Q7P37_004033 [Cladosporium fusiforme]